MSRIRFSSRVLLAAIVAGTMLGGGLSAAEPRTTDFTLKLAEFSFDPLEGVPELPEGWGRIAHGGADLQLVQFDGPLPAGALDTLRAKGLEPVQYVHPNTYIVWGRGENRQALRDEKSVRWTGEFAPAYRVQPQWRELKEDAVQVRALLYRGADLDNAVRAIELLGGELGERRVVTGKLELVGFTLPGSRLQAAASIPGVYTIQLKPTDGGSRGEISAQINAGNIDAGGIALPGYQVWLAGLGLDGSGVTVAIVDEGVDETHVDLAGRMVSCTGPSCSIQSNTHGTLVAGIVAGDATSLVLDTFGFLRGQGVAPGANLVEQRWYPTTNKAEGMLDLMTDSFANGATVSSNSWGTAGIAQGYDIDTMLVDTGVRDSQPLRLGNQSLVYVQAIDNGDGGVSSQGAPEEGKNILTVGATLSAAADGSPDPGHDNLASISGHGPALDGRTIPHLVAPGCWVDSTAPGDAHLGRCGTSYATPQVAGAAALFIEYWRNQPGNSSDPSPAMVKAALLAAAHDLEGFNDADGVVMGHRPDSKQGWGRLNLVGAVAPPAGSVVYFDDSRLFDETDQEWLRIVAPVDPAQPMRIMLTWTDAPGHGLGGNTPAWNNDLDLVVEADGNTYRGNFFGTDGLSAAAGSPDPANNAEGVFLLGPTSDVTLRVVAANINSDGVPGVGGDMDQDFALVCYNCALVPGFALVSDPTTVDVCAPQDVEYVVGVEQHSGYANPVTLSVTGVPAGATSAFDLNPVSPGGQSTLSIGNIAAVASGDYPLQVDGDSVDQSHPIPINLRVRANSPVAVVPSLPVGGAIDVAPQPILEWTAAAWTDRYVVQLSQDPTFQEIFYTGLSAGTSHFVGLLLEQDTTYYWRVRATNVCGFGAFSAVSAFTTTIVPEVLLVDDDYDLPDEQAHYVAALTALGVTFDVWDVYFDHFGAEPDPITLAPYGKVVWWSGREEVYAGPNLDSELALADWLDRAGCLMISSSDYVLNSDFSPFIQNQLGVASVVEDTGMGDVTGQGTVFGAVPLETLKNINPDYRDSLTPDVTAELAFQGDLGPAGVDKDAGVYRTSFLGFGLEDMGVLPREQTLDAFLTWCDGIPAVDGDADGVLNGADCLPGDSAAWTTPSPVTDLRLAKSLTAAFVWSTPVSGSGSVYDVIRSVDPDDFWNATCVSSRSAANSAYDDADPQPGEVWFYQVRAQSECGLSTLGTNQDGSPRTGRACGE